MELVIKLHKLKIYSANIHSVVDGFLVSPFIYYYYFFSLFGYTYGKVWRCLEKQHKENLLFYLQTTKLKLPEKCLSRKEIIIKNRIEEKRENQRPMFKERKNHE